MVRNAELKDLNEILRIYESARLYMKNTGNPSQWDDSFPPPSMIEADIRKRTLYIVERGRKICGVMEFHIGEEPYYAILDEGAWRYERKRNLFRAFGIRQNHLPPHQNRHSYG